eukprot:g1356.t1
MPSIPGSRGSSAAPRAEPYGKASGGKGPNAAPAAEKRKEQKEKHQAAAASRGTAGQPEGTAPASARSEGSTTLKIAAIHASSGVTAKTVHEAILEATAHYVDLIALPGGQCVPQDTDLVRASMGGVPIYAGNTGSVDSFLSASDDVFFYEHGKKHAVGKSVCSGSGGANLATFQEQWKRTPGSSSGSTSDGTAKLGGRRLRAVPFGRGRDPTTMQTYAKTLNVGFLCHKEERFGDQFLSLQNKKKGPKSDLQESFQTVLEKEVDVFIHTCDEARPAGKGYVKTGRNVFSQGDKLYVCISNRNELAKGKTLRDYKLLSVWKSGVDVTDAANLENVFEGDKCLVKVLTMRM